ncbi:MAG: hypothetical protein QNJ47_09625 [Nostocaceae cyanobacterium]|nr:hypothetical protein [Nostocaceae cyanobacterium]
MAEPTLIEVFGDNATQDATTLTISKADLVETGLTPAADNTAQSLIAALLKKGKGKLNVANQELDPDIQVTISDPALCTNNRNNINYDQYNYTVSFEIEAAPIDPDPDDL